MRDGLGGNFPLARKMVEQPALGFGLKRHYSSHQFVCCFSRNFPIFFFFELLCKVLIIVYVTQAGDINLHVCNPF